MQPKKPIDPRPLNSPPPDVPDDPRYVKILAPVRKIQLWLNEDPLGRKVKFTILAWLGKKISP